MENSNQKQLYPWGTLWTKPRKTIRDQINRDPHKTVLWLAISQGVVAGLYWIDSLMLNYPNLHIAIIYTLCILGGAAYGVGMLYLVSWLYTFCGKWIGGIGQYVEVKCAVGWSYYPFIIAGLFGLFSYYAIPNPWLQGLFAIISTTALVWGLIILFKGVAEAHQFGAWRGVATVIIALMIVLGAMTLLSWIGALLFGG